jgi:hypothetical protein
MVVYYYILLHHSTVYTEEDSDRVDQIRKKKSGFFVIKERWFKFNTRLKAPTDKRKQRVEH